MSSGKKGDKKKTPLLDRSNQNIKEQKKPIPEDSPREDIPLTPIRSDDKSNSRSGEDQNSPLKESATPKNVGSPTTQVQEQPQNYDEQPDALFDYFAGYLEDCERFHPETAGTKYFVQAVFLFSAIISFTRFQMAQYTNIEIYFVAFLVSFLINYTFVRSKNIRPFIENEDENFQLKVAAFSFLGSLILLIYAFQFAPQNICLCIWLCGSLLAILGELGSTIDRYSFKEILLALIGIAGAAFSIQSEIFPQDGFQRHQKLLYGLIASGAAAILSCYFGLTMRKLNQSHILTNYHVISLILVLFIPAFFPIEGLKSPGLKEWGYMVGIGIIFQIILLFVVRALQVEKAAKLMFYTPLGMAFTSILDILIFRTADGKTPLLGALIIIAACYYLSLEGDKQIRTSNHYTQQDKANKNRPHKDVQLVDILDSQQLTKQKLSRNRDEEDIED